MSVRTVVRAAKGRRSQRRSCFSEAKRTIHRFDIFEMVGELQANLTSNASLMEFTADTALDQRVRVTLWEWLDRYFSARPTEASC